MKGSGECVSCGRHKSYKARYLCETCWRYAWKLGTLEQFPQAPRKRGPVRRHAADDPLVCRCFQPIEEPISPWGVQCLKCKRPIR